MYYYKKFFYSHGKLLLTGEYFILYGAIGLALPTIKGQSLTVFGKNFLSSILHWKSYDEIDKLWFEVVFNIPSLNIVYDTEKETAIKLRDLLLKSSKIRNNFLNQSFGLLVETNLEFPRNWGLGSSSTLINNIAKWADVNPHLLLGKYFPGSGYDISCVSISKPIIYKLYHNQPYIIPIKFNPPFKDKLFFLHLNKKKNTFDGIKFFHSIKKKISIKNIESISSITLKLPFCKTLIEFEELLLKHEMIISETLNIPTIKEVYFPDYLGLVKSLGSWGGDFVLISSRKGMRNYFSEKGFHTIISFDEMIL